MTDAKEPLVRYGYKLSVRDDSAHRDAEAAVIEAAKALVDVIMPPKDSGYKEYKAAASELCVRVSVLRALEGDA